MHWCCWPRGPFFASRVIDEYSQHGAVVQCFIKCSCALSHFLFGFWKSIVFYMYVSLLFIGLAAANLWDSQDSVVGLHMLSSHVAVRGSLLCQVLLCLLLSSASLFIDNALCTTTCSCQLCGPTVRQNQNEVSKANALHVASHFCCVSIPISSRKGTERVPNAT